jgi:hypothetical protein
MEYANHAGAGPSHEAIVLKRIIALHATGHRVSPRINRLCKLFSKFPRNVLHFDRRSVASFEKNEYVDRAERGAMLAVELVIELQLMQTGDWPRIK